MATKQKSYRDLLAEGTAARVNAYRIKLDEIHEQPGFNLRDENAIDENGETFQEGIERLASYIASGGMYPPIEVRIRDEGGVWIVDGHRRTRAVKRAVEMGAPLQDKEGEVWVDVITFTGNDVDRLTRIMTSNESRKLTDLERAEGYKRLAAFGLKPAEIAEKIGRSRPHVEQMLILANANHDVQQMVREGKVSATAAIEIVRKHGEKAGAEIAGKVKAAGGGRVKEGDLKPKALPRTVVDEVEQCVSFVSSSLTKAQRAVLARAEKDPAQHAGDKIEIDAGTMLEVLKAAELIRNERARQAEKAAAKAQAASQGELSEESAA
ncbi:Nucleoid occlusion protein [Caballeronia fortuita]|uniref:Nucleoid occlusion protein n=1 Tax=Caballeronia fortuita TaxID=1777138 RepID=A0A158EA19_9BURK|nr:ParB/RepB/Spo0J family partition protein [Caballeronia fortuita]SAL03246.1 Nucleoid occlusion protein [Caballeronia fortuita]